MAVLLEALDQYDQLVLLGDTIEMQQADPRHSAVAAKPVLQALAERLGPSKRILLVAGNHDHNLVHDWAVARDDALGLTGTVPGDASRMLKLMLSWLDATQVEVHYPGLWLADGVYATHGHYLTNYMHPMASWGLHIRRPVHPTTPSELEYPSPPPREHMRDGLPPQRWLDLHIPARLAPLSSRLLDHQMQRHALPAFAASVLALGVEARWVIFGHVHRRGPREGDNLRRWRVAASGPRLLNTGSWRYEPVVARGLDGRSAYWPGGAVTIGEDGVPRSVGLLDGLSEAELLAR